MIYKNTYFTPCADLAIVGVEHFPNPYGTVFRCSVVNPELQEFVAISPLLLKPYFEFKIQSGFRLPPLTVETQTGLLYHRKLKCDAGTVGVYRLQQLDENSDEFRNTSKKVKNVIESDYYHYIVNKIPDTNVNTAYHIPAQHALENASNPYFESLNEFDLKDKTQIIAGGLIEKKNFVEDLYVHVENNIPKIVLKGQILYIFHLWGEEIIMTDVDFCIEEGMTEVSFFSLYGDDLALIQKKYDNKLYFFPIKCLIAEHTEDG